MKKYTKKLIIAPILLLTLLLTGCISELTNNGKPIEPIVAGAEEVRSPAVGQFNVKNSELQITDISVTADGLFTVVGTASKVVYLLKKEGKPVWERQLQSIPTQTYIAPDGSFIALGTEGGQLTLIGPDQKEKASRQFDAPLTQLSIAKDGSLIAAVLHTDHEEQQDQLVVMEKSCNVLWQEELGTIISAAVTGIDKRVVVNWREGEIPYFGVFSAEGELLWKLQEGTAISVDSSGQNIISGFSAEISRYDYKAEKVWEYAVSGEVSRVQVSDNGLYVGVIITDPATQHQNLLYFSMTGEKLWQQVLPVGANVVVSADGSQVIVASWGQFQDDVTKITEYDQQGQQINVLDVTGRAQKMAFASQSGTLVVGLYDGSIYFLDLYGKAPGTDTTKEPKTTDYYQPVVFGRQEGENNVTLYFYDQDSRYLIPVTRSVKSSQSLLRGSILELVRGPAQGSELQRTIPKESEIKVEVENGTVEVDLPEELNQMSGSTFLTGVLDSLLLTVSSIPSVEQIQFTVAGEERITFGQEGLLIEEPFQPQPFSKKSGERLLFLPSASGRKYYLRPVTKEFTPLKERALAEAVVQTVLTGYEDCFEKVLTLQSVKIADNIIYVDLTPSLHDLVSQSIAAAARAAMLRDALALSLVENLPYSTVKITVNGTTPKSEKHYLPWEVTVIRPYYVNMEN
ncbi:MAG TPA: GerMN domain-containing protein [Oscillospiraceae bacterium]|nr:GerMN domain-containing protein [Oscillospiraceae bacterium]